jgi:hypothetical protein
MSNRDTQFSGFAKLLTEELKPYQTMLLLALQSNDKREREWSENMIQTIIAQRAYDLACHILSHATQAMIAECELPSCIPECVESLPDLTQWPEREENEV